MIIVYVNIYIYYNNKISKVKLYNNTLNKDNDVKHNRIYKLNNINYVMKKINIK
jgi:hypothetical protein